MTRTLLAVLIAASLGVVLADAGSSAAAERTREVRSNVFEAVVDVFKDHYWQPDRLDWDAWAATYRGRAEQAATREAFDGVMRSMLDAVGDGHSSWLGLASYSAGESMDDGAEPSLGLLSRFLDGDGLVVERVLPGSPAQRAGLLRGDVLVRLDGVPLADRGGSAASADLKLATDHGSVVATVRRSRRSFEVTLTPQRLPVERLLAEPDGRVLPDGTGYLFVPSFTRDDTGVVVHDLVRHLEGLGARRMVLDLRGNAGGNLNQMGLVLGAFLGPGALAQAVSRGEVAWRATYDLVDGEGVSRLTTPGGRVLGEARVHDAARFEGAVVVLVDATTSSAGEVTALILQRAGRAEVVGEPTPGNVEAVQGYPLLDGSVVMVAVANLEAADGEAFDGGVTPDVTETVHLRDLARGFDGPVSVAQSILAPLPFLPGRVF